MKNEKELDKRLHDYFVRSQTKLDGKERAEHIEENSQKLNILKQPAERTERYRIEYETAKRIGRPTAPITARWVRDVGVYADEMCRFDKQAKADIFRIQNDFRTNPQTQREYRAVLTSLTNLYDERLSELIKNISPAEKRRYYDSVQSDRDFIRSYFEYEKYQERERSHDDSGAPTDELAPKKQPQEEHIEYADTADKSLRIPREKSLEEAFARVTANHETKQGKQKEKTLSGPKKDDDWLPGNH